MQPEPHQTHTQITVLLTGNEVQNDVSPQQQRSQLVC
jgi:hypothetical protein